MEYSAPTGKLRQLFSRGELIVAPGTYDGLSAKIAAQSGADAVYMTGFGVAGSTLGLPDVGLLSATEMADRARALAAASAPVPLIADADNGHGGVLNVARMTRLYEQAGVQCIQLEDQVSPKRCGHMAQKQVVDRSEAAAKISAAVEARSSKDFLIMARTDARAGLGLDEAIRRGEMFLRAGADLLFIEAPQSEAELLRIVGTFKDVLLVANMVEDGETPYLSADTLNELGYALALYPISSLLVAAKSLQQTYASMQQFGKLPEGAQRLRLEDYNRMIGLDQLVPDASHT